MRAEILAGLVLALGVTAAGCSDHERSRRADAKICTPFSTQPPAGADPATVAAAPGSEAATFDDCLHRWAYRLARSEDDRADLVAQATVAACAPALARWNQTALAGQAAGTSDTAVSLVTGRTNNTPADRYEMAQGKALFYVVQARAANCPAP